MARPAKQPETSEEFVAQTRRTLDYLYEHDRAEYECALSDLESMARKLRAKGKAPVATPQAHELKK